MTVIPAIDIRGGKVVRLHQGDFSKETVYSDTPRDVAYQFSQEGAQRIHVVDLEGALTGKPLEKEQIEQMIHNIQAKFQIGGGIRDPKTIDDYLKIGAWRVVLGTQSCLDKGFLKEALSTFKEAVIIGVDAVLGRVATHAWTRVTEMKASQLIERSQNYGANEIIYTDISKDGAMQGPNIVELENLLNNFNINIIASGGIRNLDDIKQLFNLGKPNLTGVIIGKAIYEGTVSIKEAIQLC